MVPARTRRRHIPQLPNRGTLDICEDTAETQEDIYGCDDEPDKAAHPACRQTKQRHCEGALAQGRGNDGANACYIGHIQVIRPIRYVVGVQSQTSTDTDRQQRCLRDEGNLNASISGVFMNYGGKWSIQTQL